MMVVEVESRRVVEEDFADLAVKGVVVEVDLEIQLLERSTYGFPEFEKPFLAGKAIRLQENLVFAVMDHIVPQMLGLRMLANMLVHRSLCAVEARISATLTEWATRFANYLIDRPGFASHAVYLLGSDPYGAFLSSRPTSPAAE
jgi:hypothetical protein